MAKFAICGLDRASTQQHLGLHFLESPRQVFKSNADSSLKESNREFCKRERTLKVKGLPHHSTDTLLFLEHSLTVPMSLDGTITHSREGNMKPNDRLLGEEGCWLEASPSSFCD